MTRSCDGCTACCEGWLWGSAHGHNFFAGRPCHFKCETGCSIYENRPEDPCKVFTCAWLTNKDIPEWLKPNLSKVIVVERNHDDIGYYIEVTEMEQKIDSIVLSWLFQYHLNTKINMSIQIAGGWMHYGTNEFLTFKGVS
jgi:hypothetical protein